MENNLKPPLILFAIGGFLPSVSLKYFIYIPYEAFIFKGVGMLLICISFAILVFLNFRISVKSIPLIVGFTAIHFFAVISEVINSPGYVPVVMLRFLAVTLICTVMLNLNARPLNYLFQLCHKFVLAFIAISIGLYLHGEHIGERFPLINKYSNSSIIFEVNMFGSLCYILFFSNLFFEIFKRQLSKFVVAILCGFGGFISFYRTIWVTFFIAFLAKHVFAGTLLIMLLGIFILADYQFYSAAFKFEQFSTLTGRDVIWSAAISTLKNNPIFGGGEANISLYIHDFKRLPWDLHSYHSLVFDAIGISGILGILGLVLYFGAILAKLASLRLLALFFVLYIPAFFNTFYLFAPNAVGFYCSLCFLMLVHHKNVKQSEV